MGAIRPMSLSFDYVSFIWNSIGYKYLNESYKEVPKGAVFASLKNIEEMMNVLHSKHPKFIRVQKSLQERKSFELAIKLKLQNEGNIIQERPQ